MTRGRGGLCSGAGGTGRAVALQRKAGHLPSSALHTSMGAAGMARSPLLVPHGIGVGGRSCHSLGRGDPDFLPSQYRPNYFKMRTLGRQLSSSPRGSTLWLSQDGLGLVRGGGGGGGNLSGGDGYGGNGNGDNEHGASSGSLLLMAALGTFKSLWGQYAELLESKPVLTKAITAGLIALFGDLLAQVFEYKLTCRRLAKGEEPAPFHLNFLRCLAVTIEGVVITGPGLHYLYTALESWMPAQRGFLAAFTHVAVDEFIFDPLFVLCFFFLCGLIEGKHLSRDIFPQVQREYWSALKGGWGVSLMFLPLEFATFRCLPLRLRVLVVNLTDVVWTAVVSFFGHREHVREVRGK
ncbi:hypothetical protein NSK_005057 [Nannochloropsis salina CCMP1776]|uniref:Uncharacterized protein n=1 Tax=Nannochloropsis salina CCMP1776 TaxID=1027361 RepID=A0A4D9CXE7_9STRA|nr:hypothetical protein NSK_005057 [Nannochloropsis salina CCMP1776]|eukprot:TFJ83962.1 hypothetical protein NSK_005057 [Nannochloropsis salina CCMP1776]